MNDFVLAEIEGRYKISDDAYVGLNYEVQSQGLGFEARYKGLFARVSADKLDYSEAKYLKFNFGVSVPF